MHSLPTSVIVIFNVVVGKVYVNESSFNIVISFLFLFFAGEIKKSIVN